LFESDDDPSKVADDPSLVGSYDLAFTSVQPLPGSAHFANGPAPSLGARVRLDLRRKDGGDGYEAVITSSWSDPVPYSVRMEDTRLVLTGEATVRGAQSGTYLTDRWASLTLHRRGDGSLDGTFDGAGNESVSMGDVADSFAIEGGGTLAADKTSPELRLEAFPAHGPSDRLLPWDPVLVRASEGVMGFAGGLQATGVAWSDIPVPSGDWTGNVLARGTFSSWDASGSVQIARIGALTDPVGNAVPSPLAAIELVPLAAPALAYDFDEDIPSSVARWGSVSFLGGGGPTDPACEQGGCVKLGPVKSTECSPHRVGIAGRLRASGASQVRVRYRVLFGKNEMSPGEKPFAWGPAFGVDVVAPGGAATSMQPTLGDDALSALTTPVLGMEWGTDWQTLSIPIEPPVENTSERGFVVYAGPQSGSYCNMPMPTPSDVLVLVDSITFEK
jgi:hypothetical protein